MYGFAAVRANGFDRSFLLIHDPDIFGGIEIRLLIWKQRAIIRRVKCVKDSQIVCDIPLYNERLLGFHPYDMFIFIDVAHLKQSINSC